MSAESIPVARAAKRAPLRVRWRQFRALTQKEISVQTSRSGIWVLQMGFLGVLATGMMLQIEHLMSVWRSFPSEIRSQIVMGSIGWLLYYGALLLGPLLAAGALEEERERGTAEVFAATPVHHADLALAMVAARMVVFLQFLIAALPILLLPSVVLGSDYFDSLVRVVIASTFVAAVTTFFSLDLAARGKSGRGLWLRLVMFVICAPMGMGLPVFAFALVAALFGGFMSFAWDSYSVGMVMLFLYFPIGSVFGVLLRGSAQAVPILLSIGTLTIYLGYFYVSFRRALPSWLERQVQGGGHRQARRRKHLEGVSKSELAHSLLGGEVASVEEEEEKKRFVPTMYFREPSSRFLRSLLRLSRQNPFLLKELRHPSVHPLLFVGAGLLLALVALWGIDGSLVADPAYIGVWTGMLVAFLSAVVAIDGSRLLPHARHGKPLEILFASPLRGRDLVAGSIATLLLRTIPLFSVLFIWYLLWALIDAQYALATAYFFHAATWLFLMSAISLWAGLLAQGSSQRVGGTLLVAVVLGSGIVPGFTWLASYFSAYDLPDAETLRREGFVALEIGVALYLMVPLLFELWSRRVRKRKSSAAS